MSNSDIVVAGANPWDQFDTDLDASTAGRATPEMERGADEALGLQMISIRLQKSLLSNLKAIAKHHGVGYQPLIRDILNRFARSELRTILSALLDEKKEELARLEEESSPEPMALVDDFFEREAKRA